MEKIKKEKGITLVALVITVAVLIIIVSVSIITGTESLDSTRLKGFYTQLEVIQKRVDDIAATNESYIDDSGNQVYLKDQGEELSESQKIILQNILKTEEIEIDITNFRYFTIAELENTFDLLDIGHNVFINFEKRIIVAEDGIKIGDKTYYVLPNTTYFVEEDTTKNIGTIQSLSYTVIQYGTDKYKVNIIPSNVVGDLKNSGYVKYKKTDTKFWEIADKTEIIIELNTEYNIQYIDLNNNKIEKTIKLVLTNQTSTIPTVIEVTQ